jgi:capsule polysaccharide export protein KpsE/RkpR
MFFEQQLQDAQTKLVEAEEKLKETQQQTGILQLDAQMRATIESVTQLKAEIAAREVELQVLGSYATAENPERVRAEEELSGLQRQLTLLENKPGGGKGDLQVPTSQIPSSGMAYLNQVRDVRYFETITELLAKQLEAAKLDEARQGSVLQVLDKATPADTKSSPKRLLIAAVAAFLGLFGSIVYLVASASPAS